MKANKMLAFSNDNNEVEETVAAAVPAAATASSPPPAAAAAALPTAAISTSPDYDDGAAALSSPIGQQAPLSATASANSANFNFDLENGKSNNNAETLNIPAVLWDRPAGSSKRVPPPVPPRSPRRPYDHQSSFAAAITSETALFRGSNPIPD